MLTTKILKLRTQIGHWASSNIYQQIRWDMKYIRIREGRMLIKVNKHPLDFLKMHLAKSLQVFSVKIK